MVRPESAAWARFIVREQMEPTEAFDVLYGGVQWGYSYTNADPPNPQPIVPPPPSGVPEPSNILLMGTALAAGLLTKVRILLRRR